MRDNRKDFGAGQTSPFIKSAYSSVGGVDFGGTPYINVKKLQMDLAANGDRHQALLEECEAAIEKSDFGALNSARVELQALSKWFEAAMEMITENTRIKSEGKENETRIRRALSFVRKYLPTFGLFLSWIYFSLFTKLTWLDSWGLLFIGSIILLTVESVCNKAFPKLFKLTWKLIGAKEQHVAKSVFQHIGYMFATGMLWVAAGVYRHPTMFLIAVLCTLLLLKSTGSRSSKAIIAAVDEAGWWGEEHTWFAIVVGWQLILLTVAFVVPCALDIGTQIS